MDSLPACVSRRQGQSLYHLNAHYILKQGDSWSSLTPDVFSFLGALLAVEMHESSFDSWPKALTPKGCLLWRYLTQAFMVPRMN